MKQFIGDVCAQASAPKCMNAVAADDLQGMSGIPECGSVILCAGIDGASLVVSGV